MKNIDKSEWDKTFISYNYSKAEKLEFILIDSTCYFQSFDLIMMSDQKLKTFDINL